MIKFDCFTNENMKEHNPNSPQITESAKMRALHAKNVLARQRAFLAYMLTCQRALFANVLMCQCALHIYVLTCQSALRTYVLTCQRAFCA